MQCQSCGLEMILDHRDEQGQAVHICNNPQCERAKKKKEA